MTITFSDIHLNMAFHRDQAVDSLSRYKFLMFGYHAACWVNLNKLLPKKDRQPSPFKELIKCAKKILDDRITELMKKEET